MPDRPRNEAQFPMSCPTCKTLAAMPYSAGTNTADKNIRVGMRCRDCGHEWSFTMPAAGESGVSESR